MTNIANTTTARESEHAVQCALDTRDGDSFAALTLGALGVVFGDIGTSPLYAFRAALTQVDATGVTESSIIGILSLALWALILIVTLKYVLFLMRADNEGEGGVLALMSLAQRGIKNCSGVILTLGVIGACLFYGDGIITPALSVLAAVEGLRSIPALAGVVNDHLIIGLAVIILVSLFGFQSRGTASVAKLFGPVCLVWFMVLGGLGIYHISDGPGVFRAFLPAHGIAFMLSHGTTGLFVLGAVFLTVTGAEALTADMGHFGRKPIQAGWLVLVFPCLALNYLGQGAFVLATLERVQAAGRPFENLDWFFLMAPESLRVPLVVLATLATIIASQAVITGAFSITQQAIRLGLLPRMAIRQTSERQAGQIYLPSINVLLLIGVLVLVFAFRSSSAMAAAYGIAVTGTMVVTSLLAFVVAYRHWGWRLPLAIGVIAPFLLVDLIFFGANILRVSEGGWVPLAVAAAIGLIIATWTRGRRLLDEHTEKISTSVDDLTTLLQRFKAVSVPGTAVFLTATPRLIPSALLHNMKHNHVLHSKNIIVHVRTSNKPQVYDEERLAIQPITDVFSQGILTYGFMQQPNLPRDLNPLLDTQHVPSYFLSRHTWIATRRTGMPYWQDQLFILLLRNAGDPTIFFQIPPNRAIEMGAQVAI